MNKLKRGGLILAVLFFTMNTWATELDTEEKKLGYIIGMDIGKSLRDQGTTVDLDSLVDAIKATYKGEDLALTLVLSSCDEEIMAVKSTGSSVTSRSSREITPFS